MKKIKVIVSPFGRMPVSPKLQKGTGLNATSSPKIPAVAIRNPFARQKG
jgi:hypothetical protein